MSAPLNRTDFRALAFLRRGAFVRLRGEWRFGTTRIGDSVIERLVETGRVAHLFAGTPTEIIILRGKR